MKTVVLQSNYIPWRGYFDLINDADQFIFYDEVQYTKNDWRNRNKLVNNNGPFWLTIPIAKDAVKLKISEVLLPESNWRNEHLQKVEHTYKKAPYVNQCLNILNQAYTKKTLSELNQEIIKTICKQAFINTHFANSSQYNLKEGKVERLLDLLIQSNTTTYTSGPSGFNYLEPHINLFLDHGIKIEFKEYKPYKQYPQNTMDFQPYVSILDCIAAVGTEQLSLYLKS